MRTVFADTSFYLAMLSARDSLHKPAVELARTFRGGVVTSEYVLCELGALMSQGHLRNLFLTLANEFDSAPYVEIIPASHELFQEGLELFAKRPDKEWSLTDCISFVLMRSYNLTDALTSDCHFEQAGFHALLAPAGMR